MKPLIKPFKAIGIQDLAVVGGKNASLGEMYNQLSAKGIAIPDGFATTSYAFWSFIEENNLKSSLQEVLKSLNRSTYANLNNIGSKARHLILEGCFSEPFKTAIVSAYKALSENNDIAVAVRSSATAEDLPDASFAGQHDTFLNVQGEEVLLEAVKKCFASLYTDRAIKYREERGFEHDDIALSVGVQKMIRADKACSGVGFTIDPESGFENMILLSGVWGLGENIVQGTVNPDEFYVFKPTLKKAFYPIVQKKLGDKHKTMIYGGSKDQETTLNIDTPKEKQEAFVLTDDEIIKLAHWAMLIEEHYQKPMDIEWAKDGITNTLYIIQARPETVHQSKNKTVLTEYKLTKRSKQLAKGNAVGTKIATGKAKLLTSPKQANQLETGDIIVTDTISPDWDPILKRSSGIITNKGGRTSHAAIVARELGVPAVVGCTDATDHIKNDAIITVSCAEGKTGYVYEGALSFEEKTIDFSNMTLPKTEVKFILSDPEKAFQLSFYPNNGVGLMRMEFTVTHMVKIHPMALVKYEAIKDEATRATIENLTKYYSNKADYFVDKLSQGIAVIASAFYPKEVILRLSDFKTNEYANLIGGAIFEPKEDNPMLGFRGASRYYSDLYKEGFRLECEAIKKVRNTMGLTNVKVMVPFCRTLEEGQKVVEIMKDFGLHQGDNGLEIYAMVEIPSNVISAEGFAEIFDGFSIGSNDLTQLTLGVDRDSEYLSHIFNENNPAVKKMISMVIETANKTGKKIGLCGQAPSDFPEFASFLVNAGIDSVSFNPDALLNGIKNINKAEQTPISDRLYERL